MTTTAIRLDQRAVVFHTVLNPKKLFHNPHLAALNNHHVHPAPVTDDLCLEKSFTLAGQLVARGRGAVDADPLAGEVVLSELDGLGATDSELTIGIELGDLCVHLVSLPFEGGDNYVRGQGWPLF